MEMPTSKEDRFVPIAGSINLRDFGGYRTTDGRRVRRGLLFRCGLMTEIEAHAYDDFGRLDIGVICDLRSDEEVETSPTPDHPVFRCRVHIPIWPGSSSRFRKVMRRAGPGKADFAQFMRDITREIVRDHAQAYRKLLAELLGAERGFLLHCSAGKDRTGVGAAIILSILGCDEATIIRDYLVSNRSTALAARARHRMAREMQAQGFEDEMSEAVLHLLSGVRAEYLHGAFDEIEASYGGMEAYLEAIGITRHEKAELRERLLTP